MKEGVRANTLSLALTLVIDMILLNSNYVMDDSGWGGGGGGSLVHTIISVNRRNWWSNSGSQKQTVWGQLILLWNSVEIMHSIVYARVRACRARRVKYVRVCVRVLVSSQVLSCPQFTSGSPDLFQNSVGPAEKIEETWWDGEKDVTLARRRPHTLRCPVYIPAVEGSTLRQTPDLMAVDGPGGSVPLMIWKTAVGSACV